MSIMGPCTHFQQKILDGYQSAQRNVDALKAIMPEKISYVCGLDDLGRETYPPGETINWERVEMEERFEFLTDLCKFVLSHIPNPAKKDEADIFFLLGMENQCIMGRLEEHLIGNQNEGPMSIVLKYLGNQTAYAFLPPRSRSLEGRAIKRMIAGLQQTELKRLHRSVSATSLNQLKKKPLFTPWRRSK